MSKVSWELFWERALSVFKYLLGIYFMIAGALTPFAGMETENYSFLFTNVWILTAFGIVIFLSGLTLVIGKWRRSREITGSGLMAVFCCFIFFGVLNSLGLGAFDPGNFIGAAVAGLLYLRWRFKTAYVDPDHFRTLPRQRKAHYPPV